MKALGKSFREGISMVERADMFPNEEMARDRFDSMAAVMDHIQNIGHCSKSYQAGPTPP